MEYVCELPERVTKLENRRGKVVATLESGMKFIVPVGHKVESPYQAKDQDPA